MQDNYVFNVCLDDEALEMLHGFCKLTGETSTELVGRFILGGMALMGVLDSTQYKDATKQFDSRYVRLLKWLHIFSK